MAEDVEGGLRVIREAFVDEVEPLIEHGSGGSYNAALMVAVGHEELARLRFGTRDGAGSFAETLPAPWRPVAATIYGAIRNGLAHGYGMQAIIVGETRVAIGLSVTATPRPHRFEPSSLPELDADATLLLNTRSLVADLRDCFDRLEAQLEEDAELRADLFRKWIRGRTRIVQSQKEIDAWDRLLGNR